MRNKRLSKLVIFCILVSVLKLSNGCQIGGELTLGPVPNHVTIFDTLRGVVLSESTTNIQRIASVGYGGALVSTEAYLTITLEDGQFVVQTSNAFARYEANEVAESFSATVTFECTGGGTTPLILIIQITDTNNNYPEFLPTNSFDFVLNAPVPPGFALTGCLNEIIVMDIDLTTSAIIFEIEDNPYFHIEYDALPCPSPGVKQFKAQLTTSTFIRNFRESIALSITATDVDATGDPPLTTSGTIRISGNTSFEFPEEPIFSQTLYFATYTEDHQLILEEPITLQQGFSENVNFYLDGDYNDNFDVSPVNGVVTLDVRTTLPLEALEVKQIYLIVKADKEFTNGGSATIVVQLPEVTPLLFESAQYRGSIIDNSLQLTPLVLSEGYEGVTVSAEVDGEYSTSFAASVQGNQVIVTMPSLAENIIENNNFISIQVVASTGRSKAITIVNLEIIKYDRTTPAFDKSIYNGSYDPANGLTVEQIVFVQGFDESVEVDILGEHRDLFQLNEIGPIIRLTSAVIPPELFEDQRITLSIVASKPRTVGANAAVIISLPSPRALGFEEDNYKGTIHDGIMTLQNILLSSGYDDSVRFNLVGDYSTFFDYNNEQNQVTISLQSPLPDDVITQNTVIMLTLTASGLNAITTTTSIVLEVVKEDTNTPVFSQNIYYGTYRGALEFEIENIYLSQGFNDEVSFRLDESTHVEYFNITSTGNSATITLRTAIPENVIFNEKVLLFNVLADKALTVGSNAAILIRFSTDLTEPAIMTFSQNYYIGSYEENTVTLDDIVLDTGFTTGTVFVLGGDHAEHFILTNTNNNVQITSNDTNYLPSEIINDNDYIILTVEAQRERAVSVMTTVIINIEKEVIITPVFNQAYYRGSYSRENQLQFTEDINLSEGYDETVMFMLEGEQSTWFTTINIGNSVIIDLNSPIPQEILDDNNQLIFRIVAVKENGAFGQAVISIDITREHNADLALGFDRVSYLGSIENDQAQIGPITLSEGYVPGVVFELHGELREYFNVTSEAASVTVALRTPIPEESVPANRIIILELQASAEQTISTYATLVYVVVDDTTPVVDLVFAQAYYTGSYTEDTGLVFTTPISLAEGYDENVEFSIEGDQGQWFGLGGSENSRLLILSIPIPAAVLLNNQQLVFTVNAVRSGITRTRATIVISLPNDHNEDLALGFDRVTYLGSIENDQAHIGPITLSEGYVPGVVFELHGELREYFNVTSEAASVTVALRTPIPEESVPANRIIILELQASAEQTISTYATLVYVVVDDTTPVVDLVFAQAYYTGSYTEDTGLVFTTPISLAEGYDENVEFSIEGDQGQWFGLGGSENSRPLILSIPIPAAVLLNNQQLVFTVNAVRSGITRTRATIVISLPNDHNEDLALGFDRVTYLGSIENDQAHIGPITLSEGYVPGVVFELHGELREYFNVTSEAASVTVALRTPIPEESVPANRIIILELQASAEQTISTYATLVYVVVDDTTPVVDLVFAQAYYTGSYTEDTGLVFTTPISLAEGYDENVEFSIEGDQGQWFGLGGSENSRPLILSIPIPAAVLLNNQQLVFTVNAVRSGITRTRATIVISLPNDHNEDLALGFDRVTYLGSIENDQAHIGPITLSEGYVPGVVFELHGELREYFNVTSEAASVTVALRTPIPEESVPANRIIILELQASAEQTISTYATLVYVVVDDTTPVVDLVFAQAYYTGSYTEDTGLVFTTPISLAEGYDENVEFSIEGDQGQWFGLGGSENSRPLILSIPIPAAVLLNNQQLVFTVNAVRSGITRTRATIVISLPNDHNEDLALGFDRVTYLGSIENDQAHIGPITLSEGYVPGVVFELHGELREYFNVTSEAASVTVALRTPIPEESVPANRIIILELQASAEQTISTYATLVYVVVDDTTPVVDLVFAQAYYTGSYTEDTGLVFTTPISLAEGYDENVEFSIEGDQGQWFGLGGSENSRPLILSIPIPAAVLLNNQQLVFTVNAVRSGITRTRATIVISLPNDHNEDLALGFDRVTYLGSIENDQAHIGPITLSEGYVPGVVFELHGELREYFNVTSEAASVTVALRTPIPEESVPASRIIILELQASAEQTISTYATLVYVVVDDTTPVVDLVFAQAYYTGSYTEDTGLVFTTPISLAEGYDENVEFSIEGDQGQWFGLGGSENSRPLILSIPIPAAVLLNNQQLVFTVNAVRSGITRTRATIVISLPNDHNEDLALGFDRVTYLGSIENDQAHIGPITLSEGYVPGVVFELHGELREYFNVTSEAASVTVALRTPIPEESVPANRIIILELQASAEQTISTYATLVYVVVDDTTPVVDLVFAQAYYTGSYTEDTGLVFTTPISLAEGYDENVEFSIEGDQGQWFGLGGSENSRPLILSIPIPAAVLLNNQQLVFTVNAVRSGITRTRATIVISLPNDHNEDLALGFDRVTYLGSIENDQAHIGPITLSEGYVPGVVFELHGELREYFNVTSEAASVTVALRTPIPEESVPASRIIILELQASAEQTISTYATLVYVVVDDTTPVVDLVFAQAYYTGSYTEDTGLVFTTPISLAEGYDENVEFSIEGDQGQWFGLGGSENSRPLILSIPIPAAVLLNNQQLVFTVNAVRSGITRTRATIVISLPNDHNEDLALGFDRVTYLGSIENDQAHIGPITLSEGYVPGVVFELHGELREYFNVTSEAASVTVALRTPIPEESVPANRIIILELQASAEQTISTYATLVYVVVDDTTPVVDLVFAQAYYTGSYTEDTGLVFTTPISLAEGYDENVEFSIEGDQGQWFGLGGSENSRPLILSIPIPAAVLLNNQQLVFTVNAVRSGITRTRATIVISLPNDHNEDLALGFDRVTYLGSIENDQAHIGPITLSEGYVPGVVFELHGELREYFNVTSEAASVTVALRTPIPEESVPANRIIILELQASAEQTISTYATLVYVVVDDTTPVVDLVFAQAYYTGSYTEDTGLVFTTPISLAEGYDENVEFSIEGDQGQWFGLGGSENSRPLILSIPIPAAVLLNNQQLVFTVNAVRSGITRTRATIVISLPNDHNEDLALGFDRVTYLGSIENDQAHIGPITLSEGYVPGVVFELHGELREYFNVTSEAASVTVALRTPIPEESVPANRIIILELQASAEQTISTYATLVYVVVDDTTPVVDLVFAQAYYTGSYTEDTGLVFTTPISLAEGYDENVEFSIEGDQGQWFGLGGSENSRPLILSIPIPAAVLLNNQQLVFTVNAVRSGITRTRATIVISLPNDHNEDLALGFDRVTYLGSIENDQAHIGPITLSEGYVPGVVFELHGELREYFNVTSEAASVTVALRTPIPEESVPANRIIILELQASAEQTISTYATLVYVVVDDTTPVVDLVFAQAYYTGSYTEDTGLVFTTPISLAEGYDENVEFSIEGDQGQWFGLGGSENSRPLILSIPIPAAVLLNNQQLVFTVNAVRSGITRTRATIVISLPNDHNEDLALGFDRVTYLGSIENDQAHIGPITLSEGYVPGVVFELHGELREYFNVTSEAASVTVALRTPIPEESVPANRIIILELQASAEQTISTYATLVYVVVDDTTPVVDLVFAQAYYTGSYTEDTGLVFTTPISLAEGYDENVEFSIEGDQGQWFGLGGSENSRPLILSIPIPAAVLLNNQQLVFTVNAVRSGITRTRATIVISLPNDHNEDLALGFDRVTYLGSIENDQAHIGPITLSEGYVPGVVFELHGELREYFNVTSEAASVTVALRTPIPEESVPANRIIILELQASAEQTISTYATLVYVVVDDTTPVVDLVFAQAYYTGSYTEDTGLVFTTPISLAEGYDENVEFSIEGDQGQWFGLGGSENSRPLILSIPIPAAVLLNNQQLVFTVNAVRSGITRTRATIVISLPNDHNEDLALGFDRVTYLGSIENDQAHIGPITLSEGYVPGVVFELHGELREYFNVTSEAASVTVALRTPIPEESVPASRIIILELQASAEQTISTYATLVYVVVDDTTPVVDLVFAQAYYTGSYTEDTGLVFTTPISLAEGYDENVEFSIEGDQGQWFGLGGSENSRPLILSIPIPAAVLLNNQQLVFTVNAVRSGITRTRATIVISLPNDHNEDLALGFDRVTYLGSIENDQAHIGPITLSEGYVPGVVFELHGELREYFNVTSEAASVTVALRTPIPEESVPANRIIILELQASAEQTISTYATLVYVVVDDTTPVVDLVFAQAYYTGSYTEDTGLVFTTPISLAEGYDENVEFSIEGDQGQWFGLGGSENSRPLILSIPIPAAVLLNNQQLVFTVNAVRSGITRTRATIVISLPNDHNEDLALGFDRVTYLGSIENDQAHIGPITLSEGYVPGVVFELHGELREYFNVTSEAASVTVALRTPIPEESVPASRIIILELQASAEQTISTYATLVYVVVDDTTPVVDLVFAQAYYTGSYTEDTGLVFTTPISLAEGYDENVEFSIEGDQGQWFGLGGSENSRPLILSIPIPAAVLLNNQQLVFTVNAVRSGITRTRATIVISLPNDHNEDLALGFDRVTYLGSIENDQAHIGPITLSEGYVPGVVFELHGELREYFNVTSEAASVTVALRTPIPEESVPANRIIILELQASAEQTISTYATLVYVVVDDTTPVVDLVFAQAYYTGSYTEDTGLVFTTPISLAEGYDENVEFSIEGDQGQWFGLGGSENSRPLILSIPIPAAVLLNNQQLVFTVNAVRSGITRTRATIVISLPNDHNEDLALGFDRVTYLGSIENDQAHIGPITLSEGYVPGVVFELHGELREYFNVTSEAASVTVALRTPIPEESVPASRIIILELQASAEQTISTYATLVYVVVDDTTPVVDLVFAQAYYTGSYTEDTGLVFTTPISLAEGYDENVEFSIEGDQGQWFGLGGSENSRPLILSIPIPAAVLLNNQQLVFTVNAVRSGITRTRATIVITLPTTNEPQTGSDESFDKVLYVGVIQNDEVNHETITITEFDGSNIALFGEYATLFESEVTSGEVTIRAKGAADIPAGTSHVAIELHARSARAVLLLNINQSDVPTPIPVVSFSSPSYAVRVTIADSGLVGRVEASADNGESIRYSLQLDNDHLQERLHINDVGELHLSAPAIPGLYTFQVVATTIHTLESATAVVHLTSEAITICGGEIVMPPLIVLDRDEEEPHYNLVNLHEGCHFTLSNRWPLDQTWLYVNETGLHTTDIDREHEAIAFMALSQVQVEITLHCETDEVRTKRSINPQSDLAEYGSSRWVLTDSIPYNSRRSLVNLVVNDINDNVPVFKGKDQEPIAVGYPVTELEGRVLPRSLAELQATDADIGENAALMYWSSEPALAVAPVTGFVHVRDGATLEHDARFTVRATDRNGQADGLTGTIEIIVKLLDQSNIVVVTVRDAFLDNESAILSHLSESVGYEIKVLRSIVISDDEANEDTRTKRDVTTTGASLQLYVYGLIDREPVTIERLSTDITNAVIAQVIIASTISLEDHLAGQEICVISGRDTGLLVATIILSVLLFIIIVLVLVWFFLRWRKNHNYDQFSDTSSSGSRIALDQQPKPVEVTTKPRLNIEELKKSERRLQEMLDAPIPEVTVEPLPARKDAVLNMPFQQDPSASMVIQSIDKLKTADDSSDDEYGERQRSKRKSVVTFNENVEKIIHVEDDDVPLEAEKSGYEIYRF